MTRLILASIIRFSEGDRAVLQVCHQLRRYARPWQRVLFQAAVQGAHGVDILLPYGEQKLNVLSLTHDVTKRGSKFTGSIEACPIDTFRRTKHPRTDRRRSLPTAGHVGVRT